MHPWISKLLDAYRPAAQHRARIEGTPFPVASHARAPVSSVRPVPLFVRSPSGGSPMDPRSPVVFFHAPRSRSGITRAMLEELGAAYDMVAL